MKFAYNRFILQILMALSLPILILSMSAASNFLFVRFIVLIILAFALEVVLLLYKKHIAKKNMSLELSSLLFASFLILFLPINAGFGVSIFALLLSVALKYIQGGFGKNIFNSALLSLLIIYAVAPNAFICPQAQERILIYLSLIAWLGVLVFLIKADFFAYLAILGFLGGIGFYSFVVYLLDISAIDNFTILDLLIKQNGILMLGIVLVFCEPTFAFSNNSLSLVLGVLAGLFMSLFSLFLPLSIAFVLSFLLISFWKYPLFAFDKKITR